MEDIFFGVSAQDWAEIIRNYILSGVAVFTAWVAWQGLTSWKKQKKWEIDRDLAKSILLSINRFKDGVFALRMVARVDQSLVLINLKPEEWTRDDKTLAEAISINIDKERSNYDDVSSEFFLRLFEAGVFWGEDFDEMYKDLSKLTNTVERSVNCHKIFLNPINLQFKASIADTANRLLKFHRDNAETGVLADPNLDDQFSIKMDQQIKRLENRLRLKLDSLS